MVFEKLEIQNFMSIRSLSLDLKDRGLVLIKGINEDNPDLNNNGSGKSSMIEALVYALYGRTLRGLKGDEIVHRKPKKNMRISLTLVDDNGVTYQIMRYRKHQVNKNKSILYRGDVDITPKSEADFNKYITNLLQADYLTFTSSLLYSAESFRFTSATDAEMKSTFDMMLGLDVFTKCLDVTKDRLKVVEGELYQAHSAIEQREDLAAELTETIKQNEDYQKEYSGNLKDRISEVEENILRATQQVGVKKRNLKKLQTKLKTAEKRKLEAQEDLAECKKSVASIEKLQQTVIDVQGEKQTYKQKIRRLQQQIEGIQEDITDYKAKRDKYDKKVTALIAAQEELEETVGTPCPTCGQPLTEESIESAKQEFVERIEETTGIKVKYENKIKAGMDEITELQGEIQSHTKKTATLQKEIEKYQKLLAKSQDLLDKKAEAETAVEEAQEDYYQSKSQVDTKQNEIKQVEKRIKDLNKDLERLQTTENPYDNILEKNRADLESHISAVASLKESIQDRLDEQQCLQFWQKAYSNQGIKSLILDDITPFLNRRVNRYLQKLTSGHIEVKFTTQTTLKSGETREKFSIEITNQDGGGSYIANSGGERKRIDLCINLALQDLVASRSSKQINIAIWDEVFDALDEIGIEKVIELLQELSSEKSTILVVSHNPHLQSYFSNILTIQKKDGYSTLIEEES